MRELEAKATKEAVQKQNRDIVLGKEGQLMEERKKRKEDKKKKEAAQKKVIEQKNKELTKTSCQLQPANPNSGTSTPASTNSNAKRASANNPQQALPRYPREVPPRFRHQEQKQLLKRGQQLPAIAANLGSGAKVANSQLGGGDIGTSAKPAANGQLIYNSKNKTDLNHSGLGSHYENSHWGPVSSNSDSSTTWDKVIVDGSDKEAWPSITGSDPELASECTDADSASSSGSEKNLNTMASGSTGGDSDGSGRSSQNQFTVGNGSNNVGNGSINGPWGVTHGTMSSTCQVSVEGPDGKSESSHNKINAWGSRSSSAGGGFNPSTLNSNANHGTWPVLENNGHNLQGPVGNSGTNIQRSTIGQMPNNQSINSKMGVSAHGSWGSLQENADSEVNGTRKVSFNGQPQNLNTEMNGPNNTTNLMTSSLPNSTGSMQINELPNATGQGVWRMSTMNPSLQASSVSNGTSISQLCNGEGINGGSYGTGWGASTSNFSGDKCLASNGQTSGDTVNATPMQTGMNGSGNAAFKNSGGSNRGNGAWETGASNSCNIAWGTGNSVSSGGVRKVWGNPAQNTGTNVSNGDWNKLPINQHSNDSMNGNNYRKGTNCWKSHEEDTLNGRSSALSRMNEQNTLWAKTTGTVESEGSTESTGSHEKMTEEGHGHHRRIADHHELVQSIVNRTDLDPRVLSNSGWGQTPIKQNTAWVDSEASPRSERKTDNGTQAWGGSVSQTSNSGGWGDGRSPNSNDTSSVSGWGDPKPATGWGDTKGSNSQGGWDDDSAATGMVKSNQSWGSSKEEKSSTWNDAQKVKQGWTNEQKPNQGWGISGNENWGDNSKNNLWGEPKKSSSGGWDSDSDRSASGWSEPGRSSTSTWGNGSNTNPSNTTGWGEPSKPNQSQGWGETSKPNQPQTWAESSKPSNSPDWNKSQDVGSWETPSATNKPSGWLGGPMPAPPKEEEPTGWEEPSPESIRRKMEIDDGTSAWGDPSKYNYKNVNMWNKNVPNGSSGLDQQAQVYQQLPPPSAMSKKDNSSISGWGEPYNVNSKAECTWGEPSAPVITVDNGTSAWGKPMDTGTSWGERTNDSAGTSSWSNTPVGQQAQNKPGPKPMQDGWCGGDDVSMPRTRHPSWEEEEDVGIGMWNSNSSQEMNSSLNWAPYMKKAPSKGTTKGGNKQDEAWMTPVVKQLSNFSFSRESSEETLQSNKMDMPGGMLQDKRTDLEKHGLNVGEYSGVIGKGSGSRPQISKESSMDRNPYLDKDGIVAEESPNVQFMSNQNLKLPSSNNALPNQAFGSVAGLGMQNLNSVRQNGNPNMFGNTAAQARGMQQPPAQPLNSSQPNLRAQVPPPLLSPQVPAPNTGGLGPLFGPQQVAMLNQLSQLNHLSQLSQLQRLLLQQPKVQNQRTMPPGTRQQHEQQGRPVGMPQPIMQLPRQLDPSIVMKQQAPPQQQPLHPPSMKSVLEILMPHNNMDFQKGPSPVNAFNSFPIGGFLQPSLGQSGDATVPQAVQPPFLPLPGNFPCGSNPNVNCLSPRLNKRSHSSPVPGSPSHRHAGGRKLITQEMSTVPKGLNSNLNVNMDINSINFKESQSRIWQWTTVDSISVNTSLDQNSSKHGAISSGFRLEDSPFVPYDLMNSSNSPSSPPGSVGDGWPRAKSPNSASNINWPPEFRPGEPWKGYPNIDPETDPYVTPGSVNNNLSINTVRDIDHLRDRNNGSSSSLNTTLPSTSAWSSIRASNYNGSLSSTAQSTSARNSDSKSTWSLGPVTNTFAHELWKVPLPPKTITARPPPGLTGQKPPSSSWDNSLRLGAGWGNSDSRYTPGSSWGDNSSGRTTNWLVLKNLTPQIDGSTLRTLCLQHGPLITFHLNLPHGNALVRYSSKEEAIKAQKSLHMCVLGNTTILAEFASEEEISRFFAQGQSLTPSPGWQSLGSSQNRIGSIDGSHSLSNRNDISHWNGAGLSGTGSGDFHGTSLWGTPNYSTSLWGTPSNNDTRGISSPSPINAFLPVDHLGGESM
ncbi:trinucleotide repeat-containing gene 6A protein isoform X2 [Latimeria chalumnae]|uniref:trinucleotide repeat-containing gene 6A protein isoform X2 n=1 Tax=Latimeria chalumnae TaxID=7897 RepID=UPI0006D93E1A|nr:PREDICTED: trinucleotide repeat-containing gene 6A protein isoform X2 [Latimeria chalumnae]|eukprot:XP_014345410.1 PREDICTED: trinucleotide repeat-containing gene 6A protein isoform X2 [Latimeria chalumnae]